MKGFKIEVTMHLISNESSTWRVCDGTTDCHILLGYHRRLLFLSRNSSKFKNISLLHLTWTLCSWECFMCSELCRWIFYNGSQWGFHFALSFNMAWVIIYSFGINIDFVNRSQLIPHTAFGKCTFLTCLLESVPFDFTRGNFQVQILASISKCDISVNIHVGFLAQIAIESGICTS